MKTFKLFLLSSILIAFVTACPKQDNPDMNYSIVNKCHEKIYLFQNNTDTIITPKSFPKQTIMQVNIPIKDTVLFMYHTSFFNNNRKLNILIYKESTLNQYSWQEIQEQNIFDKRYVLTLEELKAMNYTIVYEEK